MIKSHYLIVAPGRVGADWLRTEALKLKLDLVNNPVDLGVRMEVLASIMEEYQSFVRIKTHLLFPYLDDRVRTFCMCPHGEVVSEYNDGIITVNGHSYENRKPTIPILPSW